MLHVHDEIVLEVDATAADSAMERLAEIMKTPPEWAKGLPLDVEVKKMPVYGK